MLLEVEIRPRESEIDREANRILAEAKSLGTDTIRNVQSARSFLVQGSLDAKTIEERAIELLADTVVENSVIRTLPSQNGAGDRGS